MNDLTMTPPNRLQAGASTVAPVQPSLLSRPEAPSGAGPFLELSQRAGMVPDERSVTGLRGDCPRGLAVEPDSDQHETPAPLRLQKSGARRGEKVADRIEADGRAALCREFDRLLAEEHLSLNQAAAALGKSPSFFSGQNAPYRLWKQFGSAGLAPRRSLAASQPSDLTAEIEALGWFIPAARFFYLITNRTHYAGSVPEAIRRVISLPNVPYGWKAAETRRLAKACGTTELPACPAALREKILAREKAGQPLVPERISRQIRLGRHVIAQHRRPHEAALNYLSSPGTAMWVRTKSADAYLARAGSVLTADDGSINFPVCIPWTDSRGTPITAGPCQDKFGVIVGRFQWLRTMDVGTRFRPGWVFVARPRQSYRGRDILALLRLVTLQHGIWEEYCFERGSWKSHLVQDALKILQSSTLNSKTLDSLARLHTVFSPHAGGKVFAEIGFNQDWTKLSAHFPGCDIGRYRGDTEEANKDVQACRAGARDPRRLFPMLADAIKAFEAVTAEENATPVRTANHGRWVPEERWREQLAAQPQRKLDASLDFAFAPYVMTWKVKGCLVGGRVPLFEDMSVPFDFSAPWLLDYDGARLRLHFDPQAGNLLATPVLAEDFRGHKAGEILPQLKQVNETAQYIRLVMGWGEDDRTAGLKARQQGAAAMRRELRAVMPRGQCGSSASEMTDGIGNHSKLEKDSVSISSTANEASKMDKPRPASASDRFLTEAMNE